ncbi:hypothetical protein [Parasphingopyxis marina]|uniref:Uncharacterized protein n=1 Tax=Parasphingopyxis marina TaxID=2761622 RepID=A0A842HRD9_9SPHN|nr:hypothetical protein [Parasphingopyxis marina]MBC2776358.1 hypothetical protein [Parasphingopyxis marina]
MVRSIFPRARPANLPFRLAGAALFAGFAVLSSPASAQDGAGRGGVTAVARASATIANATELRSEELFALGDRYAEADGLSVRPIGISHRNCSENEAEARCRLVILDMP